jgi:hypothetical protein
MQREFIAWRHSSASLWNFYRMLLNPGQQMIKITATTLQRANDKRISRVGLNSEFPAIDSQENIADKVCCPFVSVYKSMIADQGFKQRG